MFDEMSCEEYYNEDYLRWMDELEIAFVNGELQMIADEAREEDILVDWVAMKLAAFVSSELEASQVA